MFRKTAIITLIVSVCVGIGYLFIGSPLFLLKEIEILGEPLIDKKDLARWGIEKEENLLLVNLGALRKRIEKIPQVRKAVIKKNLPYQLIVYVYTHKPYAFLKGDRTLGVSKEGVVFPVVKERPDPSYPQVIYEMDKGAIGEKWPFLKEGIQSYLYLKDILSIGTIKIRKNEEIILYTKDTHTEIRVGDGKLLGKRIEHLRIVLDSLELKNVDYIDLRFGKDIVVKPSKYLPKH